jgi:hypothetical protein
MEMRTIISLQHRPQDWCARNFYTVFLPLTQEEFRGEAGRLLVTGVAQGMDVMGEAAVAGRDMPYDFLLYIGDGIFKPHFFSGIHVDQAPAQ